MNALVSPRRRRLPEPLRQLGAVDLARQTVEVEDPCASAGGQTLPRRTSRLRAELLAYLFTDATTIPLAFKAIVAGKPDSSALCVRRPKDGKKWGSYGSISYAELSKRVDAFGSGLRCLGLRPGDAVAVWAENSVEWVVTALAVFTHSMVLVPIRPELARKNAQFMIKKSGVKVVVCSQRTQHEASSVIKKCKKITHLVTIPGPQPKKKKDEEVEMEDTPQLGKVEGHSFADVEQIGIGTKVRAINPDASSPALIAFTQGVNTKPKGAELTHSALIAAQAGLVPVLQGSGDWTIDSDVYYADVTFASAFHLTLLLTLLSCGATVGMPSNGNVNLIADIEKLGPTFLAGSPEVYERLHLRLMQVVAQSSSFKKWMFKKGYSAKSSRTTLEDQSSGSIWDGLVFNNIRARMGGRLRLCISSDWPLPANTRKFLQMYAILVVEVYTLTEAAGIVSATHPSDPASLHVGSPVASIEVKLVDEAKLGFTCADERPAGEICVRGLSLAQRYINNDKLTRTVFEDDGWVHTGDIGMWNENGTLQLIDRKDSIVQIQGGELVTVGKLEGLYARSQFVRQIFVHGDMTEPCLVAIVIVHPSVIRSFAMNPAVKDQFEENMDIEELIVHPKIRSVVLADLRAIGKGVNLRSCELVRAVHLQTKGWTIEDGYITPSGRPHHDILRSKYQREIIMLYEELKQKAREAVEGEEGGLDSFSFEPSVLVVPYGGLAPSSEGQSSSSLQSNSSGCADS